MLVVIQPAALEYAGDELLKIEQYVSEEYLVRLGTPKAAATVDDVARDLSRASIAHFACHGKQNRMNPLDSALVLEDGRLLVSRIMKTLMLNALLAFLSSVAFDRSEKSLTSGLTSLTILPKNQTEVNAGQKSREHSSGVSLKFPLICENPVYSVVYHGKV